MYTSFFGLTEKPFAITPDPRYLYMSERHAEALAHLLYGIDEAGGFVQLTGEVGTGKTTTVRGLLSELPAHADIALILNPRVTPLEFLAAICDELHIALPDAARHSVKDIVDHLNRFLLDAHARGRRVVVIVDEAQQLSADVLEQVRLLTNLETATTKLLQIILVGQPELRDLLERNDLRQLAQRITGRYHLAPLSVDESIAYLKHRLRVAGATGDVFTPKALTTAHRLSGGVPRLLNIIADRALLGAYASESRVVTPNLVRSAAREVHGRGAVPFLRTRGLGAILIVGLLGLCGVGLGLLRSHTPRGEATTATAPASAAAAPAPETLTGFLAKQAQSTDTESAFRSLLSLWQAPFETGGASPPPCEQAVAAGLECHADKASFAELRAYNRPAIITLSLADGSSRQVVIESMDDAHATLRAGNATFAADLLELSQWWYGDYLILWKPPINPSALIRPGTQGPEVLWLRKRLGGAANTAATADLYDANLGRSIADFQRAHHLATDGLAGTRTQLVLDGASPLAEGPRLQTGAH